MSNDTQSRGNPDATRPGRINDFPYIAPGAPRPGPGLVSEAQRRRQQNHIAEDNRTSQPRRPQREEERRPRFEVPPHQGRCTSEEVSSLRRCTMDGERPFFNLIVAGYAKQNEDTKDWYLTERGFERIREFTMANASRNVS